MKLPATTIFPASGCLVSLVGVILSLPAQTLPKINIAPGSNQTVTVSWAVPTANYVLQTTTNLTMAPAWQPSTLTVISNDNTLSVSSPLTDAAQFFRLAAAPAVDPYQVLLLTGPNHVWQFDLTNTIKDYVGNANASIPAGMVSNAPPIAFGPFTSSYVPSSATVDLGTSNVNNFNYNQSFSYDIVISQSNVISGTNFTRYSLVNNLSGSPTNGYEIALSYNSGDKTRDNTRIPGAWATVTLSFWMGDGNETRYTADINIPVGQTSHIGLCWNWNTNAFTGQLQAYLNGNFINANGQAFYFNSTNSTSTNDFLMLSRNGGVAPFKGGVQLIASWNGVVTEQQFLQVYLAYALGQTYQPNTCLYSSYKGEDTNGNQIQMSTPCIVWYPPESRYYIFGQKFGTDVQIPSGSWDATNSTKITVYTSPTLAQGTFTPYGTGISCDCSGVANIFSAMRPCVVYNPNTTNFVMWVHQVNYPLVLTNYFYLVATATNIGGPYTIVVSNALVNSTLDPGDLSIFTDINGSNAYVMYNYNNTNWIEQLTSDFLHTTTNLAFLPNSADEAPCEFTYGTNYLFFCSLAEYYNSVLATNTFGWTASSPLGPYNYFGSLFLTNNPGGTGFEGQGGGVPFVLRPSGTIIMPLDNWHNGALTNSPVSYGVLSVWGTNQTIPPFATLGFPKEIPFAANVAPPNIFPAVTNGLVNSYPLDGTLNDTTGDANGVGFNSPTYTSNFTGLTNTAISFNGSNQYTTNAALLPSGSQQYSVSCWYQDTGTNLGYAGAAVSCENESGAGYGLRWDYSGASVLVSFPDGRNQIVHYTALFGGSPTNWNMITTTTSGSYDTIFINGQQCSQQTSGPGTCGTYWMLGNDVVYGNHWKGNLSDFLIYNRALSPSEINRLYRHERVSHP